MRDIFKALSDPTRRGILELLKEQKLTVSEIAEHFDMSTASVSQHLKILKFNDLIYAERKGKYIYYHLNLSVFEELITWVSKFNN
ncbi:autorepressor SdpR family transcription factor [Staphylococcus massiliensis]|uniref:ArsR family transcription regulator n=1 Tax=Staphylococcus massiliensis S46 TaxID=1229783 RepID=K9ARY8_9STAP|nr:autorepressor SdpR family transcription factor [Staphylococcus massiliensis]EKU50069.1 ArsR family transcription regulator [Staphylococcus massiliensis S46]MCG3399172.1 autorepressor SdpR family transcription factor [Staphylococcus massiliensis]MCG3402225.1 autorepressor SdpR family transcription factor [Staphylococcus massiliensis]MCG3412808.1 autorepressor SdpR family transcription factor [Staphylococcus massiliensis]PNZ99648.1 ArsR family transcriptional regulator [Staphylococcus massili